jgi:hypothetical protein
MTPTTTEPTTDKPKGRPTELTPVLQDKIIACLRAGFLRTATAEACGVGYATLKEWVARGEGTDPDRPSTPLYATFAALVRAAEADAQNDAIKVIIEAAKDDWRAAAWYLERRWPEQFGQKTKQEIKQEITGPGGQAFGVVILPAQRDPHDDTGATTVLTSPAS